MVCEVQISASTVYSLKHDISADSDDTGYLSLRHPTGFCQCTEFK